MKEEFLQPRFDGARFSESTLPLDVTRDLLAYEALVVALAKHLYKEANPQKKRVPKGFGSNFHLHLERVDEGSARPLLSWVVAGTLALTGGTTSYFEQAKDLIAECIASPQGNLPAKFPKELLAYFNLVGRSLQEGERMELPRQQGGEAVLTQERRKDLVLAAQDFYEDNLELSGTIEVANWNDKNPTFELKLSSGKNVTVPMPAFFKRQAGEYGGRNRFRVTINGTGTFNAKRALQSVLKVRSVEVQPDYQIAAQLDQIGILAKGWHDGEGVSFDQTKLASVYEGMVGSYPEALPLPTIVPTPEGNLLFEWKALGDPSLDVNLQNLDADFHAFDEDGEDVERSFTLLESSDWTTLLEFLTQRLAHRTA